MEDLIEAANGRPVLVAYWFKHDLRRISERLSNLGIDYQQLDTDASIKKWNAGQLQVGLIHPASAGHGLNLQSGGNILVWFGLTWSLELYQQTVARLWRQGQTEGTVSVIHIVTDGSVMKKVILLWLQSWIISFRIVETRNSSGIGRTGSLYVSIIIM